MPRALFASLCILLFGASAAAQSRQAQLNTWAATVTTSRLEDATMPVGVVFHRTPSAPLPLPVAPNGLDLDKVQHFTLSFLFTLGGQYVLVNKADLRESSALPVSAGFAASIGVAKEIYDARRPGGTGFGYADLVSDAAGIAAACILIAL